MVFTQDGQIVERSHYYAYGLRHPGWSWSAVGASDTRYAFAGGTRTADELRAQWPTLRRRAESLLLRTAGKVDAVNWRASNATALLNTLDDLTTPLTKHVKYVVVGYALAALGLLDKEDRYLDSDRKSTYREYLRTSVQGLDKRGQLV